MDSVESALRFLQRSFASVAHEEAQWQEEKQRLQAQVRELENQRLQQEEAYKDAMIRIKMLEFALRQERGRYLVSPAPVSSALHSGSNGGQRKPERTEISRPPAVSVSRTIERTVSSQSSQESPRTSPKPQAQIYRADSTTVSMAKSSGSTKGLEISRPRMGSRGATSSSATDTPASPADAPKSGKPAVAAVVVKPSYRPVKLKLKLSGHIDSVRSVAFHPTEPILVSGSDDCSVRVWNLASAINGPPSQRTTELDSFLTLRTHTQSVLAVTTISAETYPNCPAGRAGAFATSGRDGSICLFNLPAIDQDKGEPYTIEDYNSLRAHTVKRAHDDAVWDLHAHPLTNVLFSAGSDGIVRTWGLTSELALKSELRCTTKSHTKATGHNVRGTLIPTSVHTLLSDSKTCVVGYTSGALAQYDFHGEQLVQMFRTPDLDTNGRESQVNRVVVHPSLPIAISAHQDNKIRMFDMRAGECVATIVAHQDAVSSLSIDSAGLYLASGGHEGSLRIWSVAERQCVYENQAHRPKWAEAVGSVTYHQSRNFIATGGADGVIKIFQ